MWEFDRIRETIEDGDLRSAEEIVDGINCYDRIRGVARKIFIFMIDPGCYTFPLYKSLLKRCYSKSRDWNVWNLIKRADEREAFFCIEAIFDEEDEEE